MHWNMKLIALVADVSQVDSNGSELSDETNTLNQAHYPASVEDWIVWSMSRTHWGE